MKFFALLTCFLFSTSLIFAQKKSPNFSEGTDLSLFINDASFDKTVKSPYGISDWNSFKSLAVFGASTPYALAGILFKNAGSMNTPEAKVDTQGKSFMEISTNQDGTSSTVFNIFSYRLPTFPQTCYKMSTTLSIPPVSEIGVEENTAKLRIWLGKVEYRKEQLIYESPIISHEVWKNYEFDFQATGFYKYIFLEVISTSGAVSILRVESLSNLEAFNCETKQVLESKDFPTSAKNYFVTIKERIAVSKLYRAENRTDYKKEQAFRNLTGLIRKSGFIFFYNKDEEKRWAAFERIINGLKINTEAKIYFYFKKNDSAEVFYDKIQMLAKLKDAGIPEEQYALKEEKIYQPNISWMLGEENFGFGFQKIDIRLPQNFESEKKYRIRKSNSNEYGEIREINAIAALLQYSETADNLGAIINILEIESNTPNHEVNDIPLPYDIDFRINKEENRFEPIEKYKYIDLNVVNNILEFNELVNFIIPQFDMKNWKRNREKEVVETEDLSKVIIEKIFDVKSKTTFRYIGMKDTLGATFAKVKFESTLFIDDQVLTENDEGIFVKVADEVLTVESQAEKDKILLTKKCSGYMLVNTKKSEVFFLKLRLKKEAKYFSKENKRGQEIRNSFFNKDELYELELMN